MKRNTSLLVIITIIFLTACSAKKNRLYFLADNVESLWKGSEVKMKGVVIGHVSSMKLLDTTVLVEATLEKDIHLAVGSVGWIKSPLIGASYIEIEPGPRQAGLLHPGDTITAKFDQTKLLDSFMSDTANQRKIQVALDTLATLLRKSRVSSDTTSIQ